MSFSRVHHCIALIRIAEGTQEPPALTKCRCRKVVPLSKATKMVKEGEASWVIKEREYTTALDICSLCGGSEDVYHCALCAGTGTMLVESVIVMEGNDIVLVSRPPADKTEKKRSSALAAKTPRTATIEEEHIQLAYVEGNKAAQERIEEYGDLNRAFLSILIVGFEPEDNERTHTGRKFDFGRPI
jgi:hypothetical protein